MGNKVTVITGASTGIGAATARRLLAEGHRVVATARNAERLERFAASAGGEDGQLVTMAGDAADHEHVAAVVQHAVRSWGRLDNVIANAGFAVPGGFEDLAAEDLRSMVLTNVLGPALLIQRALAPLRESKGRIVVIGSVAGVRNAPGNLYSVTKWAVHALAENVRQLVTADGIGVTVIGPGKVDTPFWEVAGGLPEGEALTPEQIADAVGFALGQPPTVDVNQLIVRPIGQTN